MNKIEYPWEVINKFNWVYLPSIFKDNFMRKFAMDGAYSLVKIGNTYYDIQMSKTTSLLPHNNILTTDINKNTILNTIIENFTPNAKYSINSGVLTFKAADWYFKIKIVKKMGNFNPDLITCK